MSGVNSVRAASMKNRVSDLAAACGCILLVCPVTGCKNDPGTGYNGVINAANVLSVTSSAYFSSVRVLPFGTLGSTVITGVDLQRPAPVFSLADFARAQIEALAQRTGQYPAPSLTGVVTDMPYDCATGSGTIAWDDADGDNAFSTGDTFTFTFDKCAVQDLSSLLTYSGRMTMTQFDLTGDPQGDPSSGWQMSAAFGFTDLSVTEGSKTRVYNGGFDFSSASPQGAVETITIGGQSLAGVADNTTDTLKDFSLSEEYDRVNFAYSKRTVDTTLDSAAYGVLTIKTVTPFTGAASFNPNGGALLVTASDKTTVNMTVDSAVNITLVVDANGDGITDSTQNTVWSVLQSS
jgi:hypothetical protein